MKFVSWKKSIRWRSLLLKAMTVLLLMPSWAATAGATGANDGANDGLSAAGWSSMEAFDRFPDWQINNFVSKDGRAYAQGVSGFVWQYDDGRWLTVSKGGPAVRAIAYDDGVLYGAGGQPGSFRLWKRTDSARTWMEIASFNAYDVASMHAYEGKLLISAVVNGDWNSTLVYDLAQNEWKPASASGPVNQFVELGGTLYASINLKGEMGLRALNASDLTWSEKEPLDNGQGKTLQSFGGKLYATNNNGVYEWGEDDNEWTLIGDVDELGYIDFVYADDTKLYAYSSASSSLYAYAEGQWTLFSDTGDFDIGSLYAVNGVLMALARESSKGIRYYANGEWMSASNPVAATAEADGTIYTGCGQTDTGTCHYVYAYKNGSSAIVEGLPDTQIYALAVLNGTLYAGGNEIYAHALNDANSGWTTLSLPSPSPYFQVPSLVAIDDKLYASIQGSGLWCYNPDIGSWTMISESTPALPLQTDGAALYFGNYTFDYSNFTVRTQLTRYDPIAETAVPLAMAPVQFRTLLAVDGELYGAETTSTDTIPSRTTGSR
ncbi:Kelch repeat-containing protein [Cohnella rhizosphaerae]|uniref:Uncharacterized protein n=1 Tax=Cohnella rhizosphaerae TaxID=1457232 RepID=A0A9X4L0E1_9BACL|nr:hypothetical protein [Cohnella rhizosphaerae]MDG0814233.1 hypothetical protein [Cohnella rhizosphaerae]